MDKTNAQHGNWWPKKGQGAVEFKDLECEINPSPNFWIEPKDKDPRTELQRVVLFRQELKRICPHLRAVAIPNGAKRGWKAKAQAKAEGAAWGFPDLMILGGDTVVFLEFKNGKSKPADHQIEWMNWLLKDGYHVACVRTCEGAFKVLREAKLV